MDTNLTTVLDRPAAVTAARPFYARVGALGFALLALAGVVSLIFGLAAGAAGGDLVFSLVLMAVGLLVAGLVWRFGRWALVLAAVLAFALLALLVPFSLFSLAHPESAGDFIPIVLLLAGGALGLLGSGVALVQGRRPAARAAGTRAERLALSGLLVVVALASAASLVLTLAGRTVVPAEAQAGATQVQLKNYAFAPSALAVRAGDTVRLVVKNDDSTLHTFTLPAAGVDVSVPPGAERVIEFQAPAAGAYQWYCLPHSSVEGAARTGMVGFLQAQ